MNERIQQLAEQAGLKVESFMTNPPKPFQILGSTEQFEKFAELIVRKCADRVTTKANVWGDMTGFAIKESILDCANDLKQHFGVDK